MAFKSHDGIALLVGFSQNRSTHEAQEVVISISHAPKGSQPGVAGALHSYSNFLS